MENVSPGYHDQGKRMGKCLTRISRETDGKCLIRKILEKDTLGIGKEARKGERLRWSCRIGYVTFINIYTFPCI